MKKKKYEKLIASIVIDIIGMATYLLPIIGEIFDVIWAPISSFLTYTLYQNTYFSVINIIEEIAPGTDFIPTATIAWFYETYKR